jgi:hypothetical protein
MALTLKEKAEFARLKDEVRIARALRFTDPVARDLHYRRGGEVIQGWDYNAYGDGKVYEAWSSAVHHGYGKYIEKGRSSGSQNPLNLYSTELLALRALRCELERKAAEQLAAVDARIEQLAMP